MEGVKSRLQSKTLRAALIAAIVALVRILTVVFGIELDPDQIGFWIGVALYVFAEGFNLGLLKMIWTGRVDADTKIEKLPWREEITNLTKGKNQ